MKQVRLGPVQADDTLRSALYAANNVLSAGGDEAAAVKAAESVAKAAVAAATILYASELSDLP